jgi:hypothetical protein
VTGEDSILEDHRPRRTPAPQVPQAGQRPGEGPRPPLQLIAVNTTTGQVAWLDARHRCHVHVEDDIKQVKAIGLNRWPSRHWNINVAWTTVVAMAATLLAAFRHLGLPHHDELHDASIKTLRFRFFHVPGRITRGQRKTYLHLRIDWPWTQPLIDAWQVIKALPAPP